jgi:hypothetical protein
VGSLLLGTGWVFVLFSLARCKLPPYVLPMFPPLCLVMGVAVWGIIEGCSQHKFVTYVRLHSPRDLCLLLSLAVPVAAAIDALLSASLGGANWFAWGSLAVVGIGLLTPRTLARHAVTTRWLAAAGFALLAMVATTFDFYPRIALSRSFIHPLRQACPQELAEGVPVVSVGLSREIDSLSFYFPRLPLAVFDQWSVSDAAHTMPGRGQTLLLIDEQLVDEFLRASGGETKLREVAHIHPCRVFESLPHEQVAETVTAAHLDSPSPESSAIRQTSATR